MRFTKIERAILAILEEAGEDNLAALLNSVSDAGTQELHIVDEFGAALSELLGKGFLELATSRDELSKHWVPLSSPEARQLLRQLRSFVRWSEDDELWVWNSSSAKVEALLTKVGTKAAREVLSTEGWLGSKGDSVN